MRITLNWLKDFLDTEADIAVIAEALVSLGIEVEDIIDRRQELSAFVIAKVIDVLDHPNATKLKICEVDNGDDTIQVICGAPNVSPGIKVILAPIGSVVPRDQSLIKVAKIRGIASNGMLCSGYELMVNDDNEGIMVLPESAQVGSKLIDYYGLNDPILKLSVTPNRGDCLSVYGIARELAAKDIGRLKPLIVPQFDTDLKFEFESNITITVQDFDKCSLFSLWPIRNLKNTSSPVWLQERLVSVDIKPLSILVDVTNYIAHSFGQPLHVYDSSKVDKNLTLGYTNEVCKFEALNQKCYQLTPSDLVVLDERKVHAIAGIIGGDDSSCSLDTTEAFLEAAVFDKVSIFTTGSRLQINSSARYRFERHVDSDFTLNAACFALKMIHEICEGELGKPLIIRARPEIKPNIKFDLQLLQNKTGVVLNINEVEDVITKLSFIIVSKVGNILEVRTPSWRSDVIIAEDLIEEVIRLYGYDNITMQELPLKLNTRLLSPSQQQKEDVKRILASLGYFEVLTWSFMSSTQAVLFAAHTPELCIINPISAELNYMRPCLIPNLLNLIAKNQVRSIEQIALFEIGPVFYGINPEEEITQLGVVRCGPVVPVNPHKVSREVDVFDLKGEFEYLLTQLSINIQQCEFDNKVPNYYDLNKSIRVLLNNKAIGYIGEIHSSRLSSINSRVVAMELFLEGLPKIGLNYGKKEDKFKYINYQAVKRDFAFIVDQNQPVSHLLDAIKQVNPKLIREVKVFDIYKGSVLPKNKKSVAINCLIQADDRTLTDSELQELHNQVVVRITERFKAELR